MTRQNPWGLFFFVVASLFAIAWPYRGQPARWVAVKTADRPLAAVKSWHYQLDHIDVAKLAKSTLISWLSTTPKKTARYR